MKIALKIVIWIIVPLALVAIFISLSRASFSEALRRDVFPNGHPAYLESSEVFHEENVSWILIGPSEQDCVRWVAGMDWSERITWRKAFNNSSDPERRVFKLFLNKHKIKEDDIDTVYSGIVDGSDVGYLVILKNPVNQKYFGVICVYRT